MLFQPPSCLTLEAFVCFQHDMMYHDPDHQWFTGESLGKPPTEEDLVRRWFETHAYEKTGEVLRVAKGCLSQTA